MYKICSVLFCIKKFLKGDGVVNLSFIAFIFIEYDKYKSRKKL